MSAQPSTAVEPLFQARGIVKRFGHVIALSGADFDLYPGEVLAVIGDNGAGKSTLIKVLSGALQPDEGELRLDGEVLGDELGLQPVESLWSVLPA